MKEENGAQNTKATITLARVGDIGAGESFVASKVHCVEVRRMTTMSRMLAFCVRWNRNGVRINYVYR